MHRARVAPEKADFSTRPATVLRVVESEEKLMKTMCHVQVSADEKGEEQRLPSNKSRKIL